MSHKFTKSLPKKGYLALAIFVGTITLSHRIIEIEIDWSAGPRLAAKFSQEQKSSELQAAAK
jgi:hypothetical protein